MTFVARISFKSWRTRSYRCGFLFPFGVERVFRA